MLAADYAAQERFLESLTVNDTGILETRIPGTTGPTDGWLTVNDDSGNSFALLSLQGSPGSNGSVYIYNTFATGTNTSASDKVIITGQNSALSLPSDPWTLKLQNTGNIANPTGLSFVLFDGDAGGADLNSGDPGNSSVIIDYGSTGWMGGTLSFDSTNNDIVLSGLTIPEPGSASLILSSLAGMAGLKRFRRRQG